MIRHGAQLVFAYGRATVPRICVILRKSYGGAYIVMDSKRMGNDVCLAWPWAELAVMGAGQAAAILQRRATPEERAAFEADYAERLLNPYVAAERGYIDAVDRPADTRREIAAALDGAGRQARAAAPPQARQRTAVSASVARGPARSACLAQREAFGVRLLLDLTVHARCGRRPKLSPSAAARSARLRQNPSTPVAAAGTRGGQ